MYYVKMFLPLTPYADSSPDDWKTFDSTHGVRSFPMNLVASEEEPSLFVIAFGARPSLRKMLVSVCGLSELEAHRRSIKMRNRSGLSLSAIADEIFDEEYGVEE